MSEINELQHWGIKGQKWGVRRYQNEDGSLTEEGKAHYMKAAREGKLNPKKLSDADLNMINQRFARENTYAQNVQKYRESTFSYKLQQAFLERVKGKGKENKKNGEGFVTKFIGKPIKEGIENALKFNYGDDKDDKNGDRSERTKKAKEKGKKAVEAAGNVEVRQLESYDRTGEASKPYSYSYYTGPGLTGGRKGLPSGRDIIRGQGTVHSGIRFSITRDNLEPDELMHYGIKGQKWGVRRFQNEDRTWTAAGKERYGSDRKASREYDRGVKKGKFDNDSELKSIYKMEQREKPDVLARTKDYDVMSSSEKKKFGNSVLKEINDIDDWFTKYENYSNDTDEGKAKWKEMQNRQDKLNNWLFDQFTSKSGASWENKSVSKGHAEALKKIKSIDESLKSRGIELSKKGITRTSDLYEDPVYSRLMKQKSQAKSDLVGVAIRDVGFEDTPENRIRFGRFCFD